MPDLNFSDAELDRLADALADRVAARTSRRERAPTPALLTVSATARLLGVSTKTVRRRIDARALPAVIEHGRVMLRADELRAYVEGLERVGSTPARRRPRKTRDLGLDFLRETS